MTTRNDNGLHDDEYRALWQQARCERVAWVLDETFAALDDTSALIDAMRYAARGGKRVRALLVYAAAELAGSAPEVADAPAAAVELIHAYSLVHDDLPCMDDDILRRGQPACHVQFGEALALLAGDALQAQAFALLAQSDMPDPARACALLAQACGATGMVGGQARDCAVLARDIDALEAMHRMKTGALIRAAVALGAACGTLSAHEEEALMHYADRAGLAFQVADDVLDVEGASAALGKTAGKDAEQNKTTYVSLLGLDEAKQRMRALYQEACEALALFGARAKPLDALAWQMIVRSS
jgi:Geranylgeranyl pyrophosphate synthase